MICHATRYGLGLVSAALLILAWTPAMATEEGRIRVAAALHIASGGFLKDLANISDGDAPDTYVIGFADFSRFFDGGGGIEFGPVSAVARIIDDHTITIRADLPQRILLYERAGTTPVAVTMQRPQVEIRFDEALGLALSVRLAANGLSAESSEGRLEIADLTYTVDLWPGREDSRFTIRGLTLTAPESGVRFLLSSYETRYRADSIPLAESAAMREASAGHIRFGDLAIGTLLRATFADYMAALGESLDSATWDISYKGVRYTDATGYEYTNDGGGLTARLTGGQSDAATVTLEFLDLSRFTPGDGAGGPGAVLPQGLNAPRTDIAVTLRPVPVQDLLQVLARMLPGFGGPASDPAKAILESGQAHDSLVAAGTHLEIDRASISAGVLTTTLSGALQFTDGGRLGMVGDLVWRTTGANQALLALTQMAGQDQTASLLSMALSMIVASGRGDGPFHIFDITLPLVGSPTINPPLIAE